MLELEEVPTIEMMAVRVIERRLRELPKEERELFWETVKYASSDDSEEREEAIKTCLEILNPVPASKAKVSRLAVDDNEASLGKWTGFVCERVKQARVNAGLTQEQLAEKAGLPQSHVSRIERGKHSPTQMTLQKIADALGVPLAQFDPSAP
ncbi:helix-turn-helix domain-containing protein [Planctomyces sp. SH-PL14]|uniref:helix-turn-helix domain-containing protein n=1 Tax=Planctomyces sp. SH-PL14 TaxID=1632864 RepID=UPI00078B606A|nr:helix-turn-helix transcriptional regulator [Planctomyces sp. SH-PL14]AMV18279.1 DNA-binding transcriptional repressor PuuR [Planctomyces sp. SH-PL14]